MVPHKRRLVPPEVAEHVGPFYVYVLVDPRDDTIFYVGKGTGDRLAAHGREADLEREPGQTAKTARIHAIRATGGEPRIDIVRHGLTTEREAFMIEAALIDCLHGLTNAVAGHGVSNGRSSLHDILQRYGATPLGTEPPVPALMIRLTPKTINLYEEIEPGYFRTGAGWFPGITSQQLYDATRAWWKISPAQVHKRGIRHAVAVVEGVSRALYEIVEWIGPRPTDARHAFSGRQLHEGPEFDYFVGDLGRRVPLSKSAQNPLLYWPRK